MTTGTGVKGFSYSLNSVFYVLFRMCNISLLFFLVPWVANFFFNFLG